MTHDNACLEVVSAVVCNQQTKLKKAMSKITLVSK